MLNPYCQNFQFKIFVAFILINFTFAEFQEVTDFSDPATKAGNDAGLYHSDWWTAASSHEPGWHLFDDNENGFYYTDPLRFFRMAVSLYLGAGGVSGSARVYTSSLTANANLTYYLVNVPGIDPASDYGHADLWFGYDADEFVWDVLRPWLIDYPVKTQ